MRNMSALASARTPHEQEVISSQARKRKSEELETGRRGLSTRRTNRRELNTTCDGDTENAAPAPDQGGRSDVRNADETGRKIFADSGPEEIVSYRKATRADFPLKWPRDSPFDSEEEYVRYINRYIGKEFAMTKKKNESAVKFGFRDAVHAFCTQIVDCF